MNNLKESKMKNIHLLPTKANDETAGGIWVKKTRDWCNIYITSDEEIKEGDWFYDTTHKNVFQWKSNKPKGDFQLKIILTTAPDLIKDGVQAIDDEFLQWFIENPTREFVNVKKVRLTREITLEDWKETQFPEIIEGAFSDRKPYKIIIPQGEAKQRDDSYIKEQKELRRRLMNLIDELDRKSLQLQTEQETLEEFIKEELDGYDEIDFSNYERFIKLGAKWQAERMYTEEEVLELLQKWSMYQVDIELNKLNTKELNDVFRKTLSYKEWFERVKKK